MDGKTTAMRYLHLPIKIFARIYLETFYFGIKGKDGFTSELIFYAWKQMSPEKAKEKLIIIGNDKKFRNKLI
jgi:hypothetical protein